MARARLALALVFLALGACTGSTREADEPAALSPEQRALAEAARAWQIAHDDELRDDPESFLTAVAAYYLSPGQRVALVRTEDQWTESETPSISFEVDAEGHTVVVTRGEEQAEIDARTTIATDEGASFVLSPQSSRWRVLVHDHQAPARVEFEGLAWFPVDPRFVVEAGYAAAAERTPTQLQTSRGETKIVYLAATLEFELDGQACVLQAFGYEPEAAIGEELLIPFKDETTGKQSYGAGRYVELEAPADEALTLDFNRATNPLCAYSEHYNCPMPPRFNALELAVVAGAMAPADASDH